MQTVQGGLGNQPGLPHVRPSCSPGQGEGADIRGAAIIDAEPRHAFRGADNQIVGKDPPGGQARGVQDQDSMDNGLGFEGNHLAVWAQLGEGDGMGADIRPDIQNGGAGNRQSAERRDLMRSLFPVLLQAAAYHGVASEERELAIACFRRD